MKSVITMPSGGQVILDKGFLNVTGLAWTGRGKIRKVDVSMDGAQLENRKVRGTRSIYHDNSIQTWLLQE